ncbi:MAG: response regulator [Bacteroidota bacterium]|nr:response regulator [Bacteroidota bacterium]
MKKILIIDKDEDFKTCFSKYLEEMGYTVWTEENGTKGIKLAKEILPDLILCEVLLPEIDGYTVLTELSKYPETSQIPFILTSAEKKSMSDLRYAMNMGADDYLIKPIDTDELLKVVNIRMDKYEKIGKGEQQSKVKSKETKNKAPRRRLTEDDHILIMVNNRPELIKVREIIYVLAINDFSKVYLQQKKVNITQKLLKEWECILPEDIFIRIHRSIIINLNYVQKMERWQNHSFKIYLKDIAQPLISSRRYTTKLRKILGCPKL